MRILLVDQSTDTVELHGEFFALLGHEVHLAKTAYDALNQVSCHEYDAILLGIMLPDMDGYSLACRMRRLFESRNRTSIIAVSGMAFDRNHPFAQEADFDDYLLKPVRLDVIVASLQRCVSDRPIRPKLP